MEQTSLSVVIQSIAGIGIPIAISLVGLGVLKARSNGYGNDIKELKINKAEREAVNIAFKSVNEKLDLILTMMRGLK